MVGNKNRVSIADNGAVTAEKILKPHRECTLKQVEGEEVVLCIEDTTELGYTDKTTWTIWVHSIMRTAKDFISTR